MYVGYKLWECNSFVVLEKTLLPARESLRSCPVQQNRPASALKYLYNRGGLFGFSSGNLVRILSALFSSCDSDTLQRIGTRKGCWKGCNFVFTDVTPLEWYYTSCTFWHSFIVADPFVILKFTAGCYPGRRPFNEFKEMSFTVSQA